MLFIEIMAIKIDLILKINDRPIFIVKNTNNLGGLVTIYTFASKYSK